ncbi:T9SS type A sorting domain-containing protein [Flavobacterium sp.]|uniref:T9SS type A sorting domain-containing protein n=1 Tax=Flavobacterium sp. TaxID=239 RepID=UPI00391C69D5
MIKKYFFWFCILFGLSTQAQIINIPDANFKNALVNTLCVDNNSFYGGDVDADTNNDGEIQISEALLVTKLILNNYNISSLTGIEYFTNLVSLEVGGNPLITLNLQIPSLKKLTCHNAQLTELIVDGLPNLEEIFCGGNLITYLDLSSTNVFQLNVSSNPNLVWVNIKNGVLNGCVILLMPGVDYTCADYLDCPALRFICLDDEEANSQSFYSSYPQNEVQFVTDCTLAVRDKVINTFFTLYPNPTNGILNLALSPETIVKEVYIYNMVGQKVVTFNSVAFDVSFLSQGTYFITLETDKGKATQPFVKL